MSSPSSNVSSPASNGPSWDQFEARLRQNGAAGESPETFRANLALRRLVERRAGIPGLLPIPPRRAPEALQLHDDDSIESMPERPCDGAPMRPPAGGDARVVAAGQQDDYQYCEQPSYYEEPPEGPAVVGPCEAFYREDGRNSKTVLLAMAYGLYSQDTVPRKLADFEDDVLYTNMASKKLFQPMLPALRKEIERRAEHAGINVRMRTAKRPACIEWLMDNPVNDPVDVSFLIRGRDKVKY